MKISFIGGGNMAGALVAGLAGAHSIHVVDPKAEALQRLQQQYGISSATGADAQICESDVVVLAVKPQQMRSVAEGLGALLAVRQPLVLSIAAGIRAVDLARWLGGYGKIVRTMPNTPALVGKGMTGLVAMDGVDAAHKQMAEDIMRAVGQVVWLEREDLIDPVTAVSGSGPAYVFYFIEAMVQAAEEMGLTAEQGRQMAIATFEGAAALAAASHEPVSVLRERVTSKGGTTYAALTSMEASGVKDAIIKAMKAAAARGKELGEEMGG
jgi:pyrroline-5-carboxylate reductase